VTPRLLQDWVTRQADRRPEALAVVSDAGRLTFAELDSLSTRLARLLRQRGCGRGDRVALLMPKSPLAIVGLLGIYKADGIYVPLDPASPASRLKKILESCDNRWLLAGAAVNPLLQELLAEEGWRQRLSIGWLDGRPPAGGVEIAFTLDDVVSRSDDPLASLNGPQDPAHILFTSGSTGTPKGVVITHANVIHFVQWATRYFAMESGDRVSAHPPLHFDLSFLDVFGAAAVGAELHLVSPGLNLMPNKMAEFIRASRLTQWFSVPAVLGYLAMFDLVAFGDFPSLKRVLWCGEVLPTPTLIHWMKRLPHVTFTNLYGPTETTIASSYYTVPAVPQDPQAAIPIGAACDGEELLVLDESMQTVARGEVGDLYIAGVGLSPGYWRDPEKTAAAFRPRPQRPTETVYRTGDLARVGEDGLVYFLGRSDSQIKSRGYRIELGEIEAALNAVAGLQEVAVVAVDGGRFDGAVICCAYVPAPGSDATPATLRRALSGRLPGYMLPARWLAFPRLEKNANGKIDRPRLKEAFVESAVPHAAQAAGIA
jgi:amino acid adenylation domain-containing protein